MRDPPSVLLTVLLPAERSFAQANERVPSRFALKHSGLSTGISVRHVAKHVGRPRGGQSHGALQGWPA